MTHRLFPRMKNWDVEKVVFLLVESGREALRHYDSPSVSLKEDRSIVTQADKAVEALLAREFDRPSEGARMIGEETSASMDEAYIEGALSETAWIVDPIDGTAPYSHHVPTWGISIGFAEGGAIKEGGIFLPVTGEIFVTAGPRVLSACQPRWRAAADFAPLGDMPVKRCRLDDAGLVSISQGLAKRGKINLRNPVQALCCAVMPIPYLCIGRYMAYVGTLKLWDYAAGLAIIRNCGFAARFVGGGEMTGRVEEDCVTRKSGQSRWSARDDIIFAPSSDIADHIASQISEV